VWTLLYQLISKRENAVFYYKKTCEAVKQTTIFLVIGNSGQREAVHCIFLR